MKKSPIVFLGITLLLAQSCQEKEEEWISGDGTSKDTVVHHKPYRSYHGFYYPIFGNRISPNSYNGATLGQISHPSFSPTRSGGFGSSAHSHSSSGRS